MFESKGLSEVQYLKPVPEHTDRTIRLHSLTSIQSCSPAIMRFLVVASVVCALAAVLDAYCFRVALKPGATSCQDTVDNTWHVVGSSWRNSKCMDCDCGGCCTSFMTPQSYPDDCVSEFDSEACEFKVHKKTDPSVACPIFTAIG
ncbi:unnamed protein product [Arctogadus glacialis]